MIKCQLRTLKLYIKTKQCYIEIEQVISVLDEIKKIKMAEIDEEIFILDQQTKKEFTWLEKKATKSKEYQKYLKNIPVIREKIHKLNQKKERYRTSQTFQELELTFSGAVLLLENHNVKPIMNRSDLDLYKESLPYHELTSTNDIIYVHKGNRLPNNNTLLSLKESGFRVEIDEKIGDKAFHVSVPNASETIHFSANGEVDSQMFDNGKEKKYAILIPFSEMPINRIVQAPACNTYVKGSLRLTKNTYMLVPVGEGQAIKRDNLELSVIEYEGQNVAGYADALISMLGYNRYKIDEHTWEANSKYDEEKYNKLMEQAGLSLNQYSDTVESYQEKLTFNLETLKSILNKLPIDYMSDTAFANALRNKCIEYLQKIVIPVAVTLDKYYNDLISFFSLIDINIVKYGYETKNQIDTAVGNQIVANLINVYKIYQQNKDEFMKKSES